MPGDSTRRRSPTGLLPWASCRRLGHPAQPPGITELAVEVCTPRVPYRDFLDLPPSLAGAELGPAEEQSRFPRTCIARLRAPMQSVRHENRGRRAGRHGSPWHDGQRPCLASLFTAAGIPTVAEDDMQDRLRSHAAMVLPLSPWRPIVRTRRWHFLARSRNARGCVRRRHAYCCPFLNSVANSS